MTFGAVAIGRNEGGRLERCMASLSDASCVVYVDSGSVDGSAELARGRAAAVVELDKSRPFTAARARNAGFHQLRALDPDLAYVQFIDGDCELNREWPEQALAFLGAYPDLGAVCGELRERDPDRSLYNWLCDREWVGPTGEVRATGGIVMMRAAAFEQAGGYREDVVAAEDDELCLRIRKAGWRIWKLGHPMALHDAAMTRFSQWWRRSVRAGYAFAQGAHLHGSSVERHFVWESRRAWLWGIWVPFLCVLATVLFWPWGLVAWLVYPLQVVRQMVRNSGSLGARTKLAIFQGLARLPEAWGQLTFLRDRFAGRHPQLIEYK